MSPLSACVPCVVLLRETATDDVSWRFGGRRVCGARYVSSAGIARPAAPLTKALAHPPDAHARWTLLTTTSRVEPGLKHTRARCPHRRRIEKRRRFTQVERAHAAARTCGGSRRVRSRRVALARGRGSTLRERRVAEISLAMWTEWAQWRLSHRPVSGDGGGYRANDRGRRWRGSERAAGGPGGDTHHRQHVHRTSAC